MIPQNVLFSMHAYRKDTPSAPELYDYYAGASVLHAANLLIGGGTNLAEIDRLARAARKAIKTSKSLGANEESLRITLQSLENLEKLLRSFTAT